MNACGQDYAEWLERQYRPWTDAGAIVANWATMSASYLERAAMARDVLYGGAVAQRLDIFMPAKADAPVLLFIHGGYWQALDKDHYAFAMEPLVSAGALVVSINYTLCPEVTLDRLVEQVQAACIWVWNHAKEYGGDPQRLHVSGHSAGGHLSAMMAATEWPKLEEGLPRDMIKSVIPISGLFDLEPLRLSSWNSHIRMDPETAMRNSPKFMVPTTALPVSVVLGADETDGFHRQSREFTEAWGGKAGTIELIVTPGHHHFGVIEAMPESGNLLTATILRRMGL